MNGRLKRVLTRGGIPKVRLLNLPRAFATITMKNSVDIKMVRGILGYFPTVVSNLYLKEYYERRNKVIANYYFNGENCNEDYISWLSTPKEKPELVVNENKAPK